MAVINSGLFCILDRLAGGNQTETCTEYPPTFSNKKEQISGSPTEITDIGNLFTKQF